jgi:hypothetical protein
MLAHLETADHEHTRHTRGASRARFSASGACNGYVALTYVRRASHGNCATSCRTSL